MWLIIKIYICAIIMMIGVFAFQKIVINEAKKTTKIKFLLIMQAICLLHTITGIYCTGTLKTLIMFLNNFIFYKLVYRISNSRAAFLVFTYMILLIIVDLLEILTLTKIFNITKEYYYSVFAGSITGNLTTCILVIILSLIIKKIIKVAIKERIADNKKINILFILTTICILMFYYVIVDQFKLNNDILVYLISIIVLIIVVINLIRQTLTNKRLFEKYDKLLDYMTAYEDEIEDQRILRHEIKNEFRTIKAKIIDNQPQEEIIEYIDEILSDKYEIQKEKYAQFGYLPANGIKGLCYFKMSEAENSGINISINISKRIKNSTIYKLTTKEQRDFGRILGVFLDNAIEASKKSKLKQLGIEAYTNNRAEFKLIITNTYNNQIDKEKIGREKYSTKGINRGHGLLLVKQLVEKNSRFEIKTTIQDKIYIQTIQIKKL